MTQSSLWPVRRGSVMRRDQQPQVAQVVARRPGHDGVAQGREQRAGIELGQRLLGIDSRRRGRARPWWDRRWLRRSGCCRRFRRYRR